MQSNDYQITEPHPSVSHTQYIHSGRGGAGNVSHIDPSSVTSGPNASGPASQAKLKGRLSSLTTSSATKATIPSYYYPTGRGGAGNLVHQPERPIFSFDEELDRQRRMMEHQAPIYYFGRGGAGNHATDGLSRRSSGGSDSGSSTASTQNSSSGLGGAWSRIRGPFSK